MDMYVTVVWWDLTGSAQTIDTLRAYLRDESVDAFAQVPGLRLKLWISDRETNRWGAVLLWESREAAQGPVPSRATELIGYPATEHRIYDLEASIEGRYADAALARLGLAFG